MKVNDENNQNRKKVRRYIDKIEVNNYIVESVVRGLSDRFEVDLIPKQNPNDYNSTTIIKVYEVLEN